MRLARRLLHDLRPRAPERRWCRHEAADRREQRDREQAAQRRQCAHGAQLDRRARRGSAPTCSSSSRFAATTLVDSEEGAPARLNGSVNRDYFDRVLRGLRSRVARRAHLRRGGDARGSDDPRSDRSRTARPGARRRSADQHLRPPVRDCAQAPIPSKGVRRSRPRLHAAVAPRRKRSGASRRPRCVFHRRPADWHRRLHYPDGRHPLAHVPAADRAGYVPADTVAFRRSIHHRRELARRIRASHVRGRDVIASRHTSFARLPDLPRLSSGDFEVALDIHPGDVKDLTALQAQDGAS